MVNYFDINYQRNRKYKGLSPLGGKYRSGRHFNNRDNGNREAENSAAAKSRMDFYFSPRHFPLVEIRLKSQRHEKQKMMVMFLSCS